MDSVRSTADLAARTCAKCADATGKRERVDVITATPSQLQAWCRHGEVVDGKTLVGAFWLQQVLQGTWTLDWTANQANPLPDNPAHEGS